MFPFRQNPMGWKHHFFCLLLYVPQHNRASGTGPVGQAKTRPLFNVWLGNDRLFYLLHGKDCQIIIRACLINTASK